MKLYTNMKLIKSTHVSSTFADEDKRKENKEEEEKKKKEKKHEKLFLRQTFRRKKLIWTGNTLSRVLRRRHKTVVMATLKQPWL